MGVDLLVAVAALPVRVVYLGQAAGVQDGLLQYGAIGLLAAVALFAVNRLFARQVIAHEKDIARADRLEQELRERNQAMQDRVIPVLVQATEAIAAATAVLAQHQVKGGRG